MRIDFRIVAVISLLGGLGWFVGRSVRRAVMPPAPESARSESADRGCATPEKARAPTDWHPLGWKIAGRLSRQEWESLPPGGRRRAEAVLWLATASSSDIAAAWADLATEEPQDHALLDCLLDRWVEVNPRAALAAVAGSPWEPMAWTSWGKADPGAAVREAKARESIHLWRAVLGAAASDPMAARRWMEENPSLESPVMISAIKDGLSRLDWRKAVEFKFDQGTLRRWAEAEPNRALRWALEHTSKVEARAWEGIIDHIDDQARSTLAGQTEKMPADAARFEIESALVSWTARTNPEAALRMAADAESSTSRNLLKIKAGVRLAGAGDTARSLEVLGEVMAATKPDDDAMTVVYPHGQSNSQGPSHGEISDWLATLVRTEPASTLDVLRKMEKRGTTSWSQASGSYLETAAESWVALDQQGFGDYVRNLPEGSERESLVAKGASTLLELSVSSRDDSGSGDEALRWAHEHASPAQREVLLRSLVARWVDRGPNSAQAYFSDNKRSTPDERAIYEEVKGGRP